MSYIEIWTSKVSIIEIKTSSVEIPYTFSKITTEFQRDYLAAYHAFFAPSKYRRKNISEEDMIH